MLPSVLATATTMKKQAWFYSRPEGDK
jgi:hypothetical protein